MSAPVTKLVVKVVVFLAAKLWPNQLFVNTGLPLVLVTIRMTSPDAADLLPFRTPTLNVTLPPAATCVGVTLRLVVSVVEERI